MGKREIKFRAWNPQDGMITNTVDCFMSINSNGSVNRSAYPNNTVIMQYTGLKDKNGKEIYESDICEFMGNKYKICWSVKGMMYFTSIVGKQKYVPFLNPENMDRSEVIGNIYENPELTK